MSDQPPGPASDATDMSWQDFEVLVKDIYEVLGRANGVEIECWGGTCWVQGESGVTHQIDVLTRHSDGLHEYRTAISCKCWNKKVGKSVLMEFAAILDDANLSKGIVVSNMGFTAPAQVYAQSSGIELVELRKPLDRDWDRYIREASFHIARVTTHVEDIRFQLTVPASDPEAQSFRGGRVYGTFYPHQCSITTPDQQSTTLLQLAEGELWKRPQGERCDIEFEEGSLVTMPDIPDHPVHGRSITGVSFSVRQVREDRKVVVRPEDHVYMIMESIFDGRRFAITDAGEIVALAPRPTDH